MTTVAFLHDWQEHQTNEVQEDKWGEPAIIAVRDYDYCTRCGVRRLPDGKGMHWWRVLSVERRTGAPIVQWVEVGTSCEPRRR